MSVVVHARVIEQLARLRLRYVAERLDAVLSEAARTEPTYLDFLDTVLRQEVEAKQRTRVTMALKIAHFPSVKTLDAFEFNFQPSVDQRLVRELATGRFLAQAENVVLFGAPGVGKTHLAIALGRAVVEAGHSVLFTSATALLAALAKAETEGLLADRLLFYSKPKLLIIDELGCRFSEGRDPSFSKPFPPDLSTRLSAVRTPSGCLTDPISVYTFASSIGRWQADRRLAAVAGAPMLEDGCRRAPHRGAWHRVRLIASAPCPWRAAA